MFLFIEEEDACDGDPIINKIVNADDANFGTAGDDHDDNDDDNDDGPVSVTVLSKTATITTTSSMSIRTIPITVTILSKMATIATMPMTQSIRFEHYELRTRIDKG